MGSLTPGATYHYKKINGVTYAQEDGTNDQKIIGWDYDVQTKVDALGEIELWKEIRRAAKSNPVLQIELDRVIMLYYLSKDNGKE
jgi:hypothetical protein